MFRARVAVLSAVLSACAGCKSEPPVEPKVQADGYYLAGTQAYLKGSFSEAHLQFAEVKRLNPLDPRLPAAEGEVYLAEGDVEQAVRMFEQAVRLDAKRATNWSRLGYLYALKPETKDKAMEALTKALELNAKDYNALESFADLELKQGKVDEAVKHLLAASDAAPGEAKAELVLKVVAELTKANRAPETLAILEAAAKKGVRTPDVLAELGDQLVLAVRLDEALAVYTEAAKASPKDPTLWELVGELSSKLDKPAEAEAAYRESLKVKDQGVVHVGLARLCLKRKDDACAKAELDQALAAASGEELRETLDIADLLVTLDRKRDALALLKTVSEEADQKNNLELHLKVARLARDLKETTAMQAACVRAASSGTAGLRCP